MDVPGCISDFFKRNEDGFQPDVLARCKRYVERLFSQTLIRLDDSTIFVLTGDISAMWIRDSTWQMMPLLDLNPDPELCEIIGAVSRRQAEYLYIDPYANAFNQTANGKCWHRDFPDQNDWVFERKFELDSWSTFLELAVSLNERTGYSEHMDDRFWSVCEHIIQLCKVEQRHDRSTYRFVRDGAPEWDQLSHEGYGTEVAFTGMVWSAFRPSDDRCVYGYHIPANAHLCSVLTRLIVFATAKRKLDLVGQIQQLAAEIQMGISQAIALNDRIPYEVDGRGMSIHMDDPNIPNLLSLPELGWCEADDPDYQATRDWLLSKQHKFFVSTEEFQGFSSEHTPEGFIWPLSIAMRGLTSDNEITKCLDMLNRSDGGTGDMHEAFNVTNPSEFTRSWFSWADMLYVQLAIRSISRSQ